MADSSGVTNGHSNGVNTYTVPLLINGKEETLASTFDVINPSTGKLQWKSSSASIEDAARAVEAAQKAFPAWSKTKPIERRDLFLRAADILQSRIGEYGRYMREETGALEGFAEGFNLPLTLNMLKDIAGRIITITGNIPEVGEEGRSAMVLKEPYGVVLGIAPW
jgi:acyl-CoA reductase-like NAD-dependent aldehyde dehydrogenase